MGVVASGYDEVLGDGVPVGDVDVLVVGFDFELRFLGLVDSHIDDLQGSIG